MERARISHNNFGTRPQPSARKPTRLPNELESRSVHYSNVKVSSETASKDVVELTVDLLPVSKQDIRTHDLPRLKYKPLVLRTGFIFTAAIYNLLILGLLIVIWLREGFTFSHEWGYFAIQILPPLLGSVTSSLTRAISMNLYRLMPFMLAAAPRGSAFEETILASYFPGLSLRTAIRARNGWLVLTWITEALVGFILSFKSALLNTTQYDDYVETVVTSWAVKTLIGIYGLTIVFTVLLMCKLHNKVTGLRWDPVSIADHLALFRHSDFLDKFEGTDIAGRNSIEHRFRHDRLKLGYWYRGDEIWHGFGSMTTTKKGGKSLPHTELQSMERGSQTSRTLVTQKYVSRTRYRSVGLNFGHGMACVWILLASILLAAYVLGIFYRLEDGLTISLSYNWAAIIFQFVPTFLIELFTWFWQDVDLFSRSTQPFRAMAGSNGAPLIESLLLDYNTIPPWVVTYTAFSKGHHRIALTSLMAAVQRLLPILAAGSTTIVPEDSGTTIYASKPLFLVIVAWLGIYCFLIPLEVFGWNSFQSYGRRHLPRSYSSISDLISWTYSSKLLRTNAGDAFDINMLDRKKTEQWYMNARLISKLDVTGKDFSNYAFGLYKSIEHTGVNCMGFDVSSNVETVQLLKRRRGKDTEAAKECITMHATNARDLQHLLSEASERPTDVQPLFQHTYPDQDQQE